MKSITLGYKDYILYPKSKQLKIVVCSGKAGIFTTELTPETFESLEKLFDHFINMQEDARLLRDALERFL